MADEQGKPKVEFFIPPADAAPTEQPAPAAAPVVPPIHSLAANAAALQAKSIYEQAQQQQLAAQKKQEELRQLQFPVQMRHRRATNSLVTSNLWSLAAGILAGFVIYKVTR